MEILFPPCYIYCTSQNSCMNNVSATIQCNNSVNYLNCMFSMIVLYSLAIYTIIHLVKILKNRNLKLSIDQVLQKSIFSYYLDNGITKPFIWYYTLSYFAFIAAPLQTIFSYIFLNSYVNSKCSNDMLATVDILNSLIKGTYFFIIIFMALFYGMKTETLYVKGETVILPKERRFFLDQLINKAYYWSSLYFIGLIILPISQNTIFKQTYSNLVSFNFLEGLRCFFLIYLIMDRKAYIKYANNMMSFKIESQSKKNRLRTMKKHIEDYSMNSIMLHQLVREAKFESTEKLIEILLEKLEDQKKISTMILQQKTSVFETQNSYQPLLSNPLENQLAGSLWLQSTLFIVSLQFFLMVILLIIQAFNPGVEINLGLNIFSWIDLICNLYQSTIQAFLIKIIVSNKVNYGERLESGTILGANELTSICEELSEKGSEESFNEYSAKKINSG